ncbi:dihydrolipoamide acetyltransferase family protein [Nitriliruptor alkaliphilus]|uniref:dihydrolipoamide acetyltransferase family protein n=1 Tax=Nitriliruptor alkaliphilus TaxID=427918 RepID=UPI0006976DF8|nr:dihydrolipoamide acetyltransferase family protein [Nitriliruptor alkaliphilus]
MSIRDFKLPDLGEGLEEGDVVAWHVAVGDVIELNQTVAEIETAKAIVEVPSPFAGRVVERMGEVGDTLEVGSVFLRVDTSVGAPAGVDPSGAPAGGDASGAPAGGDDVAAGTAAAGDDVGAPAGGDAGTPPTAADDPSADDLEVIVEAGPAEDLEAERPSTGLDAEAEPQPLVGYGQRGDTRRRRRGAGAVESDAPAASDAPARVLAKPPVRKLAKDLGVELAAIAPGSGPDGVITRDDVRAAADGRAVTTAPAPAPATTGPSGNGAAPEAPPAERGGAVAAGFRGRTPGDVEPVAGIRKRIVEKMELSRRTIPEATCSREADVTDLWQLRRDLTAAAAEDGHDVKVTPFAVVLRAVVVALRRFPTLNASMVGREGSDPGEIHLHEAIHLGFAADTERGLVVPVIRDAHRLTTLQIAAELNRLATAARDGKLTPAEMSGGTFTVSNYGAFGNDDGDPVINHPEGALLGVGSMRERPWVVDGQLAVRRTCRFTLAFDHRLSDGGEAGRFVTYVGDLCEQPARLLLHA